MTLRKLIKKKRIINQSFGLNKCHRISKIYMHILQLYFIKNELIYIYMSLFIINLLKINKLSLHDFRSDIRKSYKRLGTAIV